MVADTHPLLVKARCRVRFSCDRDYETVSGSSRSNNPSTKKVKYPKDCIATAQAAASQLDTNVPFSKSGAPLFVDLQQVLPNDTMTVDLSDEARDESGSKDKTSDRECDEENSTQAWYDSPIIVAAEKRCASLSVGGTVRSREEPLLLPALPTSDLFRKRTSVMQRSSR
eukprot:TRINITY_DN34844_c0_g1_i1.p1 TRINITY_DN34844_c0_g1~~TRINITY_DN34844_c0_g1_i1.p1  ORF type:complete len:169 (-),score=20.80 TRINITY_DN34844_c0_g1_i1:21-527(-)